VVTLRVGKIGRETVGEVQAAFRVRQRGHVKLEYVCPPSPDDEKSSVEQGRVFPPWLNAQSGGVLVINSADAGVLEARIGEDKNEMVELVTTQISTRLRSHLEGVWSLQGDVLVDSARRINIS
jgi:ABC-type taurine transport system ATPase subunit